MKKLFTLFAVLLLLGNSYAQTTAANSIIGKYTGYQESYVAGEIMGRDIVIPGCDYMFSFGKGAQATMRQSADNGLVANYKGSYRVAQQKNGAIVVTCNLTEISSSRYPSKPSYKLTFEKDKDVVCQQLGGPDKMKNPLLYLKKADE